MMGEIFPAGKISPILHGIGLLGTGQRRETAPTVKSHTVHVKAMPYSAFCGFLPLKKGLRRKIQA